MKSKNCPSCKDVVSEKVKFCGKCGFQFKCVECEETLFPGNSFCENCGTEIIKRTSANNSSPNKIKFHEDSQGRSFEAEFSDEVGKDITGSLGDMLTARQLALSSGNGSRRTSDNSTEDVVDIPYDEEEIHTAGIEEPQLNKDRNSSTSLFRESGERLELMETRFKATGKKDFAIRLTYLIVLFHEDLGQQTTKKSVINKTLDYCGVYDANFRLWFGKSSDFIINKGVVEFRPSGRERAKTYLEDIFNDNVVGTWSLSDLKSGGSKKSTGSTNLGSKSSSKTAAKSVKVEQFDAFNNKKSLKNLFEEKQPGTSSRNRITLIAYYIINVLKMNSFSDGHIEYGYKVLKLDKRPKHLRQTIINIKNDNLYFEDAEPKGTWKLSRNGEIFIEEELSK